MATGGFLARRVEIDGPVSDVLPALGGPDALERQRLTLGDIDLGHGIHLARATLGAPTSAAAGSIGTCDLRALGGTARGQGAVSFLRERLALEVGGSLEQMTLRPLARLLGVPGPADGQVQQANFSFRGNPENWMAAHMWAGRPRDGFSLGAAALGEPGVAGRRHQPARAGPPV